MDKGDPPQEESAPPYPGPPLNYGPPQSQVFTQQGGYPQSAPSYPGPPLNYGPPQSQVFTQQGGYPQSAPSYPGPPLNYGPPQPRAFPQQGGYPQSPSSYPGPPQNYEGSPPQPQLFTQQGGYSQASPYPPPPGGYQPGTHVIETRLLHEAPGQVLCPHCRQTVITKTKYVSGLLTWFSCVGLFFTGGVLLFFLPFCFDYGKDVEHSCPNCHQLIYVYQLMKCCR